MKNNTHSTHMHEWTELPGHHFPYEAQQIIKHRYERAISLCENKDVLEIGSGSGIGMSYLADHTKTITGLEYSAENIKLCNKNYPSENIIEGDAHEMPFEDNSFDVVIAMAMIYYLDFDIFINEVNRVLKPNGVLYFCSSNKDVPGFTPALYTTQYYSVPELEEKLEGHGFDTKFEGAFPRQIKSYSLSLLRAAFKNSIKLLFHTFPGGEKKWAEMREKTLGESDILPLDCQ